MTGRSTRREFLACAASVAATALCARRARGFEAGPRNRYIDIHTHLGAFFPGRELTAELLVRFMDEHGVEKSCVLPLISPESAPIPQPVATALAAYKQFPDRIIPFCAIDPRVLTTPPQRTGHVAGVAGVVEMLKRYQDAGCRGVGEHKTGLLFDAPQQMMFFESCAKVGFPVLFHLDDIRNIDTPGLPRLERVLKSFPELPLIGHAAGFWASICGGATFEDFGRYPEIPKPVQPGGALDRLLAEHKNLYCDLSEPGGEKAIARDRGFGREFLIRRADQLLFGTDVLMPDQPIPQFELFESLDLPGEVKRKIYYDNAAQLLKLEA